jgi:hypothetical protein
VRISAAANNPVDQHLRELVTSPDGRSIGFHETRPVEDGAFIQLDLSTGEARRLFQCNGPWLEFAWRGRRIAYLDEIDGDPWDDGELRLFDLETALWRSPKGTHLCSSEGTHRFTAPGGWCTPASPARS